MTFQESYPSFKKYWLQHSNTMRLGQAICNYFNLQCPSLFYEKDFGEALKFVSNHEQFMKLDIRMELES